MVSVIIACYNVEKYVMEAVQSVMNQTLKDIEIICVDDCSTDKTLSILELLSKEDSRIRVVRNEKNQGLFGVRFHGLQVASGEYVTFLDGDDYLASSTCEEALNIAQTQKVDIVQFGPKLIQTEGVPAEHIASLNQVMAPYTKKLPKTKGSLVDKCYVDRLFSWNLCCKLIRKEILEKAFQFYNGERLIMAEDMLGCFMVLVYAEGYAALNKPYYHYRQGSGVTSISRYLPVERMQVFAEEYQAYSLLKNWLTNLNLKDTYKEALHFVKTTVYKDMIHAFVNRTHPKDFARAAEILNQYWPADQLAIALNVALYQEADWKKKAALISSLKQVKFLQPIAREIKTVGMFYFRLYNGGVEQVMAKLAPIWQKNGWRVVIFTEEINKLDYELPSNVIRVVIPKIIENTYDDIENRTQAWRDAIRKYNIDAMVYHGWLVKELMGDQIAIKATGIPLVMHTHGLFSIGLGEPGMSYQYMAATQKDAYALCDVIVNLGEVDQAWWKALGYRSMLTVNPSTYEIEKIGCSSCAGKNILWVGRISEQKQIYEAFRIMRLVHKQIPDAKLQIVGSAETEATLEKVKAYLTEYGMNDYVSLEGYQSNVQPYYKDAALVLWTAGFEGAPMGMVEAKAYGLPIVCYELGNVDMVRKAKGMRVVRQKDSVAAANHVIALLNDDNLRVQLGRESRESVEEMYKIDLGAHWKQILELAMQPKEEERMLSLLSPLETTAEMSMSFLAKGMNYRLGYFNSNTEQENISKEEMEKLSQLDGLYLDGYFVKLYLFLNKLFPKGGRKRELIKKVASLFFK